MDNDVKIDIVQNGGSVADKLLLNNFDVNVLRPYHDKKAKQNFITNSAGQKQITTNATLLKDEWIKLDGAVTKVARERLNLITDFMGMGLSMNLENAMAHTSLQYQNQSDINDADISMDGINQTVGDRPDYDLTSLPIPIIHKDFSFPAREIATSRNGNLPLDTSMAELASRKVSETAEKLMAGTFGTYSFGGGNIYGLTNFPSRLTKSIGDWAASAKTAAQRLQDILNMLADLRIGLMYGPYGIYVSSDYEQYLDEDYKDESERTLRERILAIGADNRNSPGKVRFVKAADYLPAKSIVIVQLTSDVVQVVNGMGNTMVQWSTDGGMKFNFKVMAILVPRLRADYNGKCGILHATGS